MQRFVVGWPIFETVVFRHRRFPKPSFLETAAVYLSRTPLQLYARSNPGEPPEYCTLFNHMVKSGGSTIKDKLEEGASLDNVAHPGARCGRALVSSPSVRGAVFSLFFRAPGLAVHGDRRVCVFAVVFCPKISKFFFSF